MYSASRTSRFLLAPSGKERVQDGSLPSPGCTAHLPVPSRHNIVRDIDSELSPAQPWNVTLVVRFPVGCTVPPAAVGAGIATDSYRVEVRPKPLPSPGIAATCPDGPALDQVYSRFSRFSPSPSDHGNGPKSNYRPPCTKCCTDTPARALQLQLLKLASSL